MKFRIAGFFLVFVSVFFNSAFCFGSEVEYGYMPGYEQLTNDLYLSTEIPVPADFNYVIAKEAGANHIMLPIRSVLNEYAQVNWVPESKTVEIICGTMDISLNTGDKNYVINGENAVFDAAPLVYEGRVYVPATFFEKTFGFWINGSEAGMGLLDLFMPTNIIENI